LAQIQLITIPIYLGDDGSEDFEAPELVMDNIEAEPLTSWEREHQAYQKLCRGEGHIPERWDILIFNLNYIYVFCFAFYFISLFKTKYFFCSIKSKMYCYYSHGHNAYLKIMPYPVEIVSLEPRIEIYHQVLNDPEIELIKELATPKVRILLVYQ